MPEETNETQPEAPKFHQSQPAPQPAYTIEDVQRDFLALENRIKGLETAPSGLTNLYARLDELQTRLDKYEQCPRRIDALEQIVIRCADHDGEGKQAREAITTARGN